jgi:predicted nucleotidyltransferase component of viral defense system
MLEPWLGRASFDQSEVAPKLRFRTPAEEGPGEIKLKVEINTREIEAYDKPQTIPLPVKNPWFTGVANIETYSREELLATKLRALLQRDKGRDLFDLAQALALFPDLNTARIVECMGLYLKKSNLSISRAEAEQRMFAKLAAPRYLADMRPLVRAEAAAELSDEAMRAAFAGVFKKLITPIPGAPWAKTPELWERFGFDLGKV